MLELDIILFWLSVLVGVLDASILCGRVIASGEVDLNEERQPEVLIEGIRRPMPSISQCQCQLRNPRRFSRESIPSQVTASEKQIDLESSRDRRLDCQSHFARTSTPLLPPPY